MPSLAGNQVPTDLVTAVDLSAAPSNQNVRSTLNDLFATITKNITDRAIRFQAPGSAPAVSAASQGALYHNGTSFQASSNGGAYEQVFTLATQTAALVFAGPATGGPAVPTFRALALTDLPQIATDRLLGRVASGSGEVQEITPGAGVLTWLQTPSSANLPAAVTDETGGGLANDGVLVFNQSPTIVTPTIESIRTTSGSTALTLTGLGSNNRVNISPANQPTGPTIEAAGSPQTDIALNIRAKGAEAVQITGTAVRALGVTSGGNTNPGILEARGGNQANGGGKLYLYERSTNGTNYVGFEAPDDLTSDLFWTLPATDGTANQALVTDGGAGLSWASFNDAGFKNFLINGDFQIAQRSTSVSAIITSGYYTADRWRSEVVIAPGPNGQFTQTVASGSGDYPDNSGFRNSLKMECSQTFSSLGATAETRIEQRIEGVNCLPINFGQSGAQQLTLSFWVKSSNTGKFIVELIQPAGSVQVSAAYTINDANTWEQKSVTFPARTTGTLIVNDNTYQLAASFWLVAGSNYTGGTSLQTTWGNTANRRATGQTNLSTSGNYLQITGVQLEIGTSATDFENLDAGLRLMFCQRYFYLIASGNGKQISNTVAQFGNQGAAVFKYPVTMRSAGAIVQISGTNYYGIWNNGGVSTFNDFQSIAFTTDGVLLYRDGLILTMGQAGYFFTNNAASFVAISAEL